MIGQRFTGRAMIVVDEGDGQVHAWDVTNAVAEWEWTGMGSSGRSTARVTIRGEMHRRTRSIASKLMKITEGQHAE